MSVDVVFETHSLTVDNETGRATGWLDGSLSSTGRALAAELGERRRDDGIAAVYTSDLGRAVETAQIAFRGSALPILRDRRLRECNYGSMNGLPRAELDALVTGLDERYPGGETWREALERVFGFVAQLVGSRDGERVLVIGHMSGWYALESLARGVSLEEAFATPMQWQEGWSYVLPRIG